MMHAPSRLFLDRASVIFYPSGWLRFQSFCFWLASAFGTSLWRGPHVVAAVEANNRGELFSHSDPPRAHCRTRGPDRRRDRGEENQQPPANCQYAKADEGGAGSCGYEHGVARWAAG